MYCSLYGWITKTIDWRTRVPIPMSKGHDRKCDYEYERLGVCNIFLANEPLVDSAQ